ncbi:MAG: hypothetical protein ABL899_00425 [Nitrospira sp.]
MQETKCYACNNELGFKPWDNGLASFEICPFCGIQFGYVDAAGGDEQKRKRIYENWNVVWLKNGKKILSKDQESEVIKSSE